MKITRRQLRRLIEGSVKKRGGYTIPAENPIGDPLKDLDYSSDQKSKIKMLALSGDEEIQTQADLIADIGGYEADNRFGADTFSRQVQAGELGIDMLNDLDIDSALSKACEYWIYENKDYLSYFDHIDQDTFRDYADYMIEEYAPDIIVSNIKTHTLEVLNKRIKSLIAISNSAAAVPSVDASIAKYESAKKLFSLDHDNPIVEDHVMDKFKSILYSFYLDWKVYYEKEQGWDMHNPESVKRYKERIATFKEGKMKITRRQLKKLIEMAVRDLSIAQNDPEDSSKFKFGEDFPEGEAQDQYDTQLLADLKSAKHIRDYFINSAIDIDVIVLPANIINAFMDVGILSSYSSKFIGILDSSAIAALSRGKYKKYKQVISKIRPDAFTMIMQSHEDSGQPDAQEKLQQGEYSLSWGLHDAVGHLIQDTFSLKDAAIQLLSMPFDIVGATIGKNINPFSGGKNKLRRFNNPGEFIKKIEGPSIEYGERFSEEDDQELRMAFRSDLLKFFIKENFTPEVGYEDSHASICAYYFVHRKLPDPFYDTKYVPAIFTNDEILDFQKESDNAFQKLAGKTAILNFLKRDSPHVSGTSLQSISAAGYNTK